MKVKGTGSRCLLEECVKDNYYARFHPHSYHCCKEMKFIPRLDANCGRTDGRTDGRTNERTNERKVEPLYRTLLKAGAIKTTHSVKFCIPFGRQKKCFCPQTDKRTKQELRGGRYRTCLWRNNYSMQCRSSKKWVMVFA